MKPMEPIITVNACLNKTISTLDDSIINHLKVILSMNLFRIQGRKDDQSVIAFYLSDVLELKVDI